MDSVMELLCQNIRDRDIRIDRAFRNLFVYHWALEDLSRRYLKTFDRTERRTWRNFSSEDKTKAIFDGLASYGGLHKYKKLHKKVSTSGTIIKDEHFNYTIGGLYALHVLYRNTLPSNNRMDMAFEKMILPLVDMTDVEYLYATMIRDIRNATTNSDPPSSSDDLNTSADDFEPIPGLESTEYEEDEDFIDYLNSCDLSVGVPLDINSVYVEPEDADNDADDDDDDDSADDDEQQWEAPSENVLPPTVYGTVDENDMIEVVHSTLDMAPTATLQTIANNTEISKSFERRSNTITEPGELAKSQIHQVFLDIMAKWGYHFAAQAKHVFQAYVQRKLTQEHANRLLVKYKRTANQDPNVISFEGEVITTVQTIYKKVSQQILQNSEHVVLKLCGCRRNLVPEGSDMCALCQNRV
ncbi:hypothetical protein DAMA08_018260 [Martiniozyma asiatica (nom. inval.)]|nr:hypothetical protein DAMA08_018260 [Martiniozyma asiatica]